MLLKNRITQSKILIRKAIKDYKKIALACSFGKDSIVVLHLALQVNPKITVFTIMTPFKPKETFQYKDKMIKAWRLNIKEYFQEDDISAKKRKLWLKNPDECCEYFKVNPTRKAVSNLDAWITGLRCTEGKIRKKYQRIEYKNNLVKINPILNWTELDIWKYIAINKILVHPWYEIGYRSLGCKPCTKIIQDSEPERAGRWAGHAKCGGECGIHTKDLK